MSAQAAAVRDCRLPPAQRPLPPGDMVIVDDADHLPAETLQWLAEYTAATNTKLLLITTPDHRTIALLSIEPPPSSRQVKRLKKRGGSPIEEARL
ncbi:hypothetical protein, partial [Mycobacterium avium]|uniref:hypothetical protein n=1 Tax=Mycobacterium avium TaxID=1764 RepID=UPI0012DA6FB9